MTMSDDARTREYKNYIETSLGDTAKRIIDTMNICYVKFDVSDTAPDYIGLNEDKDADDGDTDWVVYKFTYSGTAVTTIKKAVGSWTGRAALF